VVDAVTVSAKAHTLLDFRLNSLERPLRVDHLPKGGFFGP
jgi:hypothetical protein